MKRFRMTYCGMDGEGRTVTEAKADAARKLASLVNDLDSEPAIVAFRGHAKLVYRSARSWCAMILTNDSGTVDGRRHGVSMGDGSRQEAITAAAQHVADLAWSHDVGDDLAFAREALAPYIDRRLLDTAARDLASRWVWQRRYRAARDAGYSDADALHIAGGLGHLVPGYADAAQ